MGSVCNLFFLYAHFLLDVCMVMEVLGPNLLKLIKAYHYKGIPLPITKAICRDILEGLDYIHRELKIIHTDLKPENILLNWPVYFTTSKIIYPNDSLIKEFEEMQAQNQEDTQNEGKKKRKNKKQKETSIQTYNYIPAKIEPETTDSICFAKGDSGRTVYLGNALLRLKSTEVGKSLPSSPSPSALEIALPHGLSKYHVSIADFGNGCWTYKHFTTFIQTREYRSPEALFESEYSCPCDIWSFGCIVFEMLTGDYLFDPRNSHRRSKDQGFILYFYSISLCEHYPIFLSNPFQAISLRWSIC